ncbi:MAG TPA: ATPase, partial [Succinivibrionaceae bacterium]|nr:ATPase [Succinivibrionaceae bacterium]
VLAVFESIPQQLAKENRRFVFSKIRESARARDYQKAIVWLTNAGIAVKVPRVTKPRIPLSSYQEQSIFKFFLADVGLLGAMAGLNPSSVLAGNTLFNEFKGALTEQFVRQQLQSALDLKPYYWSADNSRGEIDFLVQDRCDHGNSKVVAIEVKAEENLKAKSLKAFKDRYPEILALRLSLSDLREQDWMCNVPLYAFSNRCFWLKSDQNQ